MGKSVIGGIIGAAIGFVFGAGPVGAAIGWQLGSAAGALLTTVDAPLQDGPRLTDLKLHGSEYGRAIPIIDGTVGLSGNVIWQIPDLIEEEVIENNVRSFVYYASFAVLIGEGPLKLKRIWAGLEKRLIWDTLNLEGGGTITFYNGSATQLPDPLMESYKGVGNVPAYRGYSYVVFERFPVARDSNRIPVLTIEASNAGDPTSEGDDQLASFSLGTSWTVGEIFTSQSRNLEIGTFSGTSEVVIARNLSNNGHVAHYTLEHGRGDTHSFYDAARNKVVYIDSGNVVSWVAIDDGTQGTWNGGSWPTGGSIPSGGTLVGGVCHAGSWVFLGHYGSGVFLSVVNPDAVTSTTYTGDSGSFTLLSGFCAHISDAETYVLAVTLAGQVRRYHLTAGLNPEIYGGAVPNADAAAIDPNTGYVWTAGFRTDPIFGGKETRIICSDPVLGFTYSDSDWFGSGAQFLAGGVRRAFPWLFIPITAFPGATTGQVILIFEKYLATDYFEVCSANTGGDLESGFTVPGHIGATEGVYHGTASMTTAWWNPVQVNAWFARDYGYGNRDLQLTTSLEHIAVNDYSNGDDPGSGFYWGRVDTPFGSVEITLDPVTLASVVRRYCLLAGFTEGEIDVSQLESDFVDGYAVAKQASARQAIQPLMGAYSFDAVESEGVLKFVKRGGAVSATIPDEDLGAHISGNDPEMDLMETTRRMEDELPHALTVTYINRNTNYEPMSKQARRIVGNSGDEQEVDLPIVMTDTKGQEVAELMLHQTWVGRKTYAFQLPIKYVSLEATDIVDLREQTMMLTKVTRSGGVIKCEGVFDDFNYVPHVVVTETPTSGQVVSIPSETVLFLFDINAASDSDIDAGTYACACGTVSTWSGADLFVSIDGGTNYTSVIGLPNAGTMGLATNALGSFHSGNIVDELNALNVTMLNGTLTSTTAEGLLSGVNRVVLGNEEIWYRDATLETDGSYTLTGLLRGRRGTEGEMDSHAVGDHFALVDTALVRVPGVTADQGIEKSYKARTRGLSIDDAVEQLFTNNCTALKPLAPVHLGGGRDASNNLTLNWIRRNVSSGEWRDSVDVPMTEATEAYEVDIYNGSGYATVLRTISVTAQSAAYSAANQTSDGLTPGATVYFKVYQLSAVIGRGEAATGSV